MHRRLAAAVTVALAAGSALVASPVRAQTATPGVTDDSVEFGFISSATGPASSTGKDAEEACRARIGRANAEGGVHGRTIELIGVDDQSSPANLDKAKDLVENRGVFGLANISALGFFAYRYLVDAGVPVIGAGFDGSYYYDAGNENIISGSGPSAPIPGITTDISAKMMKKLGGTKLGTVGYGISESSKENAKATYEYAASAQGLEPVYLNTSVDFGSVDVGPIVLGIKNSGADSLWLPLDASTNLAIATGLQQNGVQVQANIMATGYGQDLLDSPTAAILTDRDVFQTQYRPVELGGKGVKQFLKDRKKYSSLSGVPGFGEYSGYIACDLIVTGLDLAGKNLTRQGFVDAIRSQDAYPAAGLSCRPYDYTLETFGHIPDGGCLWYVVVKDGKFKVLNNGKPLSGHYVGKQALLDQYVLRAEATTTTTRPG
jgi:branched-chain amino acid transport system substrate-binding protein